MALTPKHNLYNLTKLKQCRTIPKLFPDYLNLIKWFASKLVWWNWAMLTLMQMLGFYGIDFNGGKLKLTSNHKERSASLFLIVMADDSTHFTVSNLRSRSHNLLRLTRILKHLSEFPQLQPHAAALVLFFVATHSAGMLDFSQGVMRGDSMDQWWSNCFRNEGERKEIRKIVQGRGQFGQGTWDWEEYNEWYEQRREVGKVGFSGQD